MAHGTKIATCCYCGTRAALVLRGEDRHELSCASCGAPLHDMKMLRSDAVPSKKSKKSTSRSNPKQKVREFTELGSMKDWERKSGGAKKKKKKRKSLANRFLSEAFDVLDDIFD